MTGARLLVFAASVAALGGCGAKSQLLAGGEPERASERPERDPGAEGEKGGAPAGTTGTPAGSPPLPTAGSKMVEPDEPDPVSPQPPGSLDATFGVHGSVHGTFRGQLSDPRDLVVDADGKILLAGCAQDHLGEYADTTIAFALARYLADGSPDLGFGEPPPNSASDGQVLSLLSPRASCALELALWSDGRIAAAGHADQAGSISDLALAVYTQNGLLDASFGGPPDGPLPGSVTPDTGGYSNDAVSFGVQLDSKPVVVGRRIFAKQGPGFGVLRFDATGARDAAFHFALDSARPSETDKLWIATAAEGVVIQSDGKVVIAGMVANDLGLLRLSIDGELDHDFGAGSAGASDGMVVTALGARSWPTATAQAAGDRIVLAGGVDDGGVVSGVLVRYTKAGKPDVSFGEQGIVMSPKEVGAWRDVAVADDGKVVAVSDYSIVRFRPDGSLDLEFGDHGIVTVDFPVSEVAVGSDGKIVVAGMIVDDGSWSFALARFWP